MTSCLKDAVTSVLARAGTIPFDWSTVDSAEKSDMAKAFQTRRIWNNQVQRELQHRKEEGVDGYLFEWPAILPELVLENTQQFLEGVTYSDACWRMHVVDFELDDSAGNMDQNLFVIALRDLAIQYFTNFTPDNCSTLMYVSEEMDYDHTGVYHYIVTFKCGFKDTKGSYLDPDQVRYIYKEAPTNLELETGFAEPGEEPVDPHTSYIWQDYEIQVLLVPVPNPLNTQHLGNGAVIPIEYAINDDGTFTVPYLNSIPGIQVLTPFMNGNQPADTTVWRYSEDVEGNVFDNSAGGGFGYGNEITFNASLPNIN